MLWPLRTTTLVLFLQCWCFCTGKADSEAELLGCLSRSNSPERIKKLRLPLIRQDLLARLGLDKEPANPSPRDVQISKERPGSQQQFDAVQIGNELQDQTQKPCVNIPERTSRLLVYFPAEVQTEAAPGSV